MLTTLDLNSLPLLPQVMTLKRVAATLWQQDDVAALWLGGSFARGQADALGDLDLRVAVAEGSLDLWSSPHLSLLIGENIVGIRFMGWDRTVLHQIVLENGAVFDLLVQSMERDPPEDHTLVLGCRDTAFGALLARASLPPSPEAGPADPGIVRQVITDFWIDSHKHAKVLSRGLDMIVLTGLSLEQPVLLRLWYIDAIGQDLGTQRPTIHTLTETVRTITASAGSRGLEIVNVPRGNRAEIHHAIEASRSEVAEVGRRLANRLGFEYPEALEQTVRQSWQHYLKQAA